MKRELFQVSDAVCEIAVYDMRPGSNEKWTWEVRSSGRWTCPTVFKVVALELAVMDHTSSVPAPHWCCLLAV